MTKERRRKRRAKSAGAYTCPHCLQTVDTWPDPGGGLEQEYIEDCALCCRPNRIVATFSPEEDGYVIVAHPDV